ncbi:hypothetical protein CAEBREN_02009 [Caenorhabditis brenneri]|uniref:non-specific serine/threonine protein kinase n=1 Tax=Caenorhabditis brenneri TaxID=135651 RepID=G0NUL1_CAEBE|nr:hypothetical protein CAEBREN_02009 [Caenorhabditis brenneri]
MTSKNKEDQTKAKENGKNPDIKHKKDDKKEIDPAENKFNIDSELDEGRSNEAVIIEIGTIVTAPTKLHDWLITRLIGEGAFAKVFMGRNHPSGKFYAVKIESRVSKMDFTSNEITALYAIKLIHEKGFIHRDIKPDNLIMGAADDQKRWRLVHVIDFGLARQWAVATVSKDKKSEAFCARPLRTKVSFRGSMNFASPNAHLFHELGRRDDLWSLLFTLVEFNGRVPWFGVKDHSILVKQKTDPKTILTKMPKSFERLIDHLKGLTAIQRPNYHMFFKILQNIFKASGQTVVSKYTFEDTELTEKERKDRKVAEWEEEKGTFFAMDSVKITSPKDCIDVKNKDLMIPNNDKFENVLNDFVEDDDLKHYKQKFEKKKYWRPLEPGEVEKRRIPKAPTDEKKTKLFYEFKSVAQNENYITRLDDSQNRFREYNFEVKNAKFEQEQAEARNQLAEKALIDKRNALKTLQEGIMKGVPSGGHTDEQKEDVNMGKMIANKDHVLKLAQLDVLRKMRDAREKEERERKMAKEQ